MEFLLFLDFRNGLPNGFGRFVHVLDRKSYRLLNQCFYFRVSVIAWLGYVDVPDQITCTGQQLRWVV